MNVYRTPLGLVLAPSLLAVVKFLVDESRDPPRPAGPLGGDLRGGLEVDFVGPVVRELR